MKKLNAFMKKIDSIKTSRFFILTFIIFFVLQILIVPKLLFSNFIHAEDGGVFTSDELRFGPGSLFIPFGGYLVMISRVFSIIAIGFAKLFNTFDIVPQIIMILSASFVSFVASYFASDRFEFFIKGRLKRLLVSALMILLCSDFIGLLFNGVSIHWWTGVFIFFVSLELLHGNLPSKFVYPVVLLSIFSSPSALVIAFSALYYLYDKYKNGSLKRTLKSKYIIFFTMVFISLAVQAYFILFRSSVDTMNSSLSVKHVLSSLGNAYTQTLNSPFFVFSYYFFKGVVQNAAVHVIGAIIWLAAFFIAKKKGYLKYLVFSFISIFFVYLMTFYKTSEKLMLHQHNVLGPQTPQIWYNVLPAAIVFVLAAAFIIKHLNKKYAFVVFAFSLVLGAEFYCIHWKPDTSYNNKLHEASEHVDFTSKTYAVVKTAPYYATDWWTYTRVPVNPEYCQTEGVVCETFDD